ncbi:flagellar protein FliT [Gallaecimonas sp. GXIMD4217]|uniref:flagellar protein FliT n=1 Tax=Gallaecimonas sp. GXIMD4217 TaxID=3131927 RepID=UPI00311B1345
MSAEQELLQLQQLNEALAAALGREDFDALEALVRRRHLLVTALGERLPELPAELADAVLAAFRQLLDHDRQLAELITSSKQHSQADMTRLRLGRKALGQYAKIVKL